MSIVIVDYHKGNLLSVERGLVGAGADVVVTDKADVIRAADAVEGGITGRAIYDGTLTVADGVAACDGTFHLSDQLEEEGRPLTIEELES